MNLSVFPTGWQLSIILDDWTQLSLQCAISAHCNQIRMDDTSPVHISEWRGDSDFMIGRWRRMRRHLTLITENRRRVVALKRIVKDNVFGGACHSTSSIGSSRYCPPSATMHTSSTD